MVNQQGFFRSLELDEPSKWEEAIWVWAKAVGSQKHLTPVIRAEMLVGAIDILMNVEELPNLDADGVLLNFRLAYAIYGNQKDEGSTEISLELDPESMRIVSNRILLLVDRLREAAGSQPEGDNRVRLLIKVAESLTGFAMSEDFYTLAVPIGPLRDQANELRSQLNGTDTNISELEQELRGLAVTESK